MNNKAPLSRAGGLSRAGAGGGASLFDVMHGTSQSRAVVNNAGKLPIWCWFILILMYFIEMRFSANDGRVSQAVYDDLNESPNRLNPNKVLQRENLGAKD